MDTYFASPERVSGELLEYDIRLISENAVIDGLMQAVNGLFAVLNEHRQIVSLNDAFLDMLGVGDAGAVLGLRPGEAIGCIHADDMPGGCGTSELCQTCGAAIAIVVSRTTNQPVERICAVTVNRDGQEEDLYMRVRSCPIMFGDRQLLLLFLQDITKQQQLSALEQVFFHDLSNIITALLGTSQLLARKSIEWKDELEGMNQLSMRLAKEVEIQRCLAQMGDCTYQAGFTEVSLQQVFEQVKATFLHHPVMIDKILLLPESVPDYTFSTDFYLLMRIIQNMVTNALEASTGGDTVRVAYQLLDDGFIIEVWNKQGIPSHIAKRIFQRNFSTKEAIGRGMGTYSMKLFGEKFLGGEVSFTSSEEAGTTFFFKLPSDVNV